MRSAPDKSFIKYVQEATSWNTLCRDFGYASSQIKQNIETIKKKCRRLGVSYDHLILVKGQIPLCYQCTDARFEEIISQSQTWMTVMMAFGYTDNAAPYTKTIIKKRCNELGVTYDHIDKKVRKREPWHDVPIDTLRKWIAETDSWCNLFHRTICDYDKLRDHCRAVGIDFSHLSQGGSRRKRARDDIDADGATGAYNLWLAPGCRLDEPGWRY